MNLEIIKIIFNNILPRKIYRVDSKYNIHFTLTDDENSIITFYDFYYDIEADIFKSLYTQHLSDYYVNLFNREYLNIKRKNKLKNIK